MINPLGTIQALVAIVPAVFLCFMIYRMDKVEKEPMRLIILTFILGAVAAIPIIICEVAVDAVLGWLQYRGFLGTLLYMLLGVALIEEFFKLCATLPAYKSRHFNYTFDGIVYCASAALGYACLENILYIVGSADWLSIAVARGFLSVPGHMCDGIFMGLFVGWAKYYSVRGQKSMSRSFMVLALAAPIFEHMVYDTLCQFGDLPVIAWSILVYILAFIAVGMSKGTHDRPIYFDWANGQIKQPQYGQMPYGQAPYYGQQAPQQAPLVDPTYQPQCQYWQDPAYRDNPRHPYQR